MLTNFKKEVKEDKEEVQNDKVILELESSNFNVINDFILKKAGLEGLTYVIYLLNSVKK